MILGEARVRGLKEIFKFSLVFLTKLLAVCCQDLFLSELVDRQGKQRQKFILHLAFHLCDNRNAPTGCSSGVEPTSCYQKVASLIPLVCMSKCKNIEPQKLLLMCWSAPCMAATTITISVWIHVWITVSCCGQKCQLNALNVNVN